MGSFPIDFSEEVREVEAEVSEEEAEEREVRWEG